MSAALPGAHFDWPLSRDEKKHQIMQLYDRELQWAGSMLQSHEAALGESCACPTGIAPLVESRDCHHWRSAVGLCNSRLSDASTAVSEHSTSVQPHLHIDVFCDDQLGAISEEHSNLDGHAHGVAERLREAVAEAAMTLQALASRPRRPSAPPTYSSVMECGSPAWPRAASEEASHGSSTTRSSSGHREGQRRKSRDSRSRYGRSAPDCEDSDGEQADTEEFRQMEISSSRRRRRSLGMGPVGQPRAALRVKSCNMDSVAECDADKSNASRSRSVPPQIELESLQAFLGESVPCFPFR